MGRPLRNIEIGVPYHVVHRGNRQMKLFESDADRRYYLGMLGSFARRHSVRIAGFCLMTNHVHFAVIPGCTKGISRCFGQLHKRYAEMLNMRQGRRGCCWQRRLPPSVFFYWFIWPPRPAALARLTPHRPRR